jgi:hypothetical protein
MLDKRTQQKTMQRRMQVKRISTKIDQSITDFISLAREQGAIYKDRKATSQSPTMDEIRSLSQPKVTVTEQSLFPLETMADLPTEESALVRHKPKPIFTGIKHFLSQISNPDDEEWGSGNNHKSV